MQGEENARSEVGVDAVPNGDDCLFAWQDSLTPEDWGRHVDEAKRLFAHVPLDRLIGAFERNPKDFATLDVKETHALDDDVGDRHMPALFDLCVRVLVPFCVIDAALQARLPMLTGRVVLARRADDEPPPVVRASPTIVFERSFDRWWVSCCACGHKPHWACEHIRACPRPWLRRISHCDAMRIVAWHWIGLIDARYSATPGKSIREGGYCRGLYESEWFEVIGANAILMEEQPASDFPSFVTEDNVNDTGADGDSPEDRQRPTDTGPDGLVKSNDTVGRGVLINCCCAVMSEIEEIAKLASRREYVASRARVYHPWYPSIVAHHAMRLDINGYRGDYVIDWEVAAFVDGDDAFFVDIYP